jgi:hypothetical protein
MCFGVQLTISKSSNMNEKKLFNDMQIANSNYIIVNGHKKYILIYMCVCVWVLHYDIKKSPTNMSWSLEVVVQHKETKFSI